ncbi:hypothetical protein K493DRAFT_294657 [Basidiobolus meristosporus CBS 931.73]|uniref:Arrestin C-terminal-like domain-containing protein n=1 Tax=Basidiobolus meristosporus CBS 931.73 TaxID=1314790 RepID=A0A1Y1VT84_9FUNG|nr:hypothetical protein K493DRAFT_294657 [Basidiobolus meristosporus CBS 931.73]|eukprot:ORX64512.1 hypothetical protein K493DRAFT_294657 [Basidiobolus meristosporus CBS 931.73]
MFGRNSLSIHLENNHIILRGTSQESAGYVLRGFLLLQIHQPTRIKSIELNFIGQALIQDLLIKLIPLETKPYKRTIVEKNWCFTGDSATESEEPRIYQKGKYEYHFEMPLHGNIPQSIHTPKGNISYQFKAIARKSGFRTSLECDCSVHVERSFGPLPTDLETSLIRTGDVQGQMKFSVALPCCNFTTGQQIPIMLGIRPLSRGIKVFKVNIRLKETVRYRTFFEDWSDTHEERIDETSCIWRPKVSGWWEQPLVLKIPKGQSSVRADNKSRYIHLWHFIEVQINLVDLTRKKRYLTVQIPIHIFSEKLIESEEALPVYEATPVQPPDYLSSVRQIADISGHPSVLTY